MLRWSAVSLLLVCLTLTTFGQSPTHEHIPAPSDIIDGAKTPDLIPDVVAWRLWLLAATAGDSKYPDLASPRRTSFLRVAGIGPDDMPVCRVRKIVSLVASSFCNNIGTTSA